MRFTQILLALATLRFARQSSNKEWNGSCDRNCSRPDTEFGSASFVELRSLYILDIFPVEQDIPIYKQLLLVCYDEIKSNKAELISQILEDDRSFIDYLETVQTEDKNKQPEDTDPLDLAALNLVRKIRDLHETGAAYAQLISVGGSIDERRRQSTELWEQFSRSAVESLLSHSPR